MRDLPRRGRRAELLLEPDVDEAELARDDLEAFDEGEVGARDGAGGSR